MAVVLLLIFLVFAVLLKIFLKILPAAIGCLIWGLLGIDILGLLILLLLLL